MINTRLTKEKKMRNKKAKAIRRLAEKATIGKPDKSYKTIPHYR